MTPELAAELIDFALNPEFLTFILDEADRRYQSKLQKQPFVFGAAVTVGYYGREIKGYADAEHRCELAAQDMLRAEKERDELLQRLADYEHETLTVKEALAEKMKAIGEYGLMMQQRDEAIRQAEALANMIESLFCNPEGRASFEGSQGDKDIFNQGFEKFKAWREGEG